MDLDLEESPNFQKKMLLNSLNETEKLQQCALAIDKEIQFYFNIQQNCSKKDSEQQKGSLSQLSWRESSKKLSSMLAGKKSRQKKKQHVQSTQNRIKQMQKQISRYEQDIKKTKETLSKILQSVKYNQNYLTYSEIQACLESEDPNEDKINLLLDMIKFRVGGCGNQRQAKILYFIKQLMNTLFPPFQRYLLYTCQKKIDLFHQSTIDELLDIQITKSLEQPFLDWTQSFLKSLNLGQNQKNKLLKLGQTFLFKKRKIIESINETYKTKNQIVKQQKKYEEMITQIRRKLNPLQAAVWVLFSDRIRYKREIILNTEKQLFSNMVSLHCLPYKKFKNV